VVVCSACTQQQQQILRLLGGKELYSKLQTTATTELQNNNKPKTWQAQRGKKFKTSISLHTEDLHFSSSSSSKREHEHTLEHIHTHKQNRKFSAKHVIRMLDKQ
jgi:hypothetical protein